MCVQGGAEVVPGVRGEPGEQSGWRGESQRGMPQLLNSEWGLVGHDRILGFILGVMGAIVGFAAMDLRVLTRFTSSLWLSC